MAAWIDAGFRKIGGRLRHEGLKAHRWERVTPNSTDDRGTTVPVLAANVQGIATLQMLNILEQFDLKGAGFQFPPQ